VTAAILQAACVILILCSQSSLTPKLLPLVVAVFQAP